MGDQKFRKRMAKLKIVFLSIALCWSLPLQAYDIEELVKIGLDKECYRITLTCDQSLISFYHKNNFKVDNIAMKRRL